MTQEQERAARRIYPDWLKQPYSENAHNLADTLGRIADRVDGWTALEREKEAALAWCRSHGDPHLNSKKD